MTLNRIKNKFNEGDFLQHIRPYKGEHEKLIVKVNMKEGYYECVWMKGKHCSKINFGDRERFAFDVAHKIMHKVG